MVQNADPSNPDAFRSCGQPEILNGATGAIHIRIAHRGTPQHLAATPLTSARDTQIHRCLLDPFQLETAIQIGSGSCIPGCCLAVHFMKQRFDLLLRGAFSDHHKIPGLHQSDRAGMMCRRQEPRQHVAWNRRRQKIPADIPALEDRSIYRLSLRFRKLAVPPRRLFHSFTPLTDPLA